MKEPARQNYRLSASLGVSSAPYPALSALMDLAKRLMISM